MCRLVGYLGPPTDLATLFLEPPHSLHEQSWAPRDQAHGTINADGWGVGWYDGERSEPARYRCVLPMWSDPHLRTLLPAVRTRLAIAAVRSATAPSPSQLTNTPPYASGRLLLAHNGAVEGWSEGVGESLRRSLPIERAAALEGSSDSELLLALVQTAVDGGATVPEALGAAIGTVLDAAPARLNLVCSDGTALWATRVGDALSIIERGDGPDRSVVVASEPLDDDDRWTSVPEDRLVEVTAASVEVRAIPDRHVPR